MASLTPFWESRISNNLRERRSPRVVTRNGSLANVAFNAKQNESQFQLHDWIHAVNLECGTWIDNFKLLDSDYNNIDARRRPCYSKSLGECHKWVWSTVMWPTHCSWMQPRMWLWELYKWGEFREESWCTFVIFFERQWQEIAEAKTKKLWGVEMYN